MVKTFAKITDGIVTNFALAEDVWPFEDDPHIEVPSELRVEIGWSYLDKKFVDLREPYVPTLPN
jgi:hypothetical protein